MSARKKVNDKDESRFLREGRGWNDKGRELEQNVKFKNEQESDSPKCDCFTSQRAVVRIFK